jgi:hypothetical protein
MQNQNGKNTFWSLSAHQNPSLPCNLIKNMLLWIESLNARNNSGMSVRTVTEMYQRAVAMFRKIYTGKNKNAYIWHTATYVT